jgi:hypothetical protein
VDPTTSTNRPGVVTALAVFQFLGAGFWLLAAVAIGLGAALSEGTDRTLLLPVGLVLAGLGALQAACGVGLWTLRPYGRILQIVFACIGVLAVPFGTVVAILVLVYLTRPGMKVVFSGKPAEALTADERARIVAVTQPSAIVVAIVAVVAVFGTVMTLSIVAAIAVPGLLRARMTANESAAIVTLSGVATAEAIYAASCGNGGFASAIGALTAPMPNGKSMASPELETLATSGRFGYFFTLGRGAGATNGPVDCNGTATVSAWYASATPQTFGSTGTRSFATSAGGEIWQSDTPTAPEEPFGAPATIVRGSPRARD